MRLKWLGVLALILALALTVVRGYVGATIVGDTIIGLLMAFGLVMVIIDCHTDNKKYIESLRNKEERQCSR